MSITAFAPLTSIIRISPLFLSILAVACGGAEESAQVPHDVIWNVVEPLTSEAAPASCLEAGLAPGSTAAQHTWAVGTQLVVRASFQRSCGSSWFGDHAACEPLTSSVESNDVFALEPLTHDILSGKGDKGNVNTLGADDDKYVLATAVAPGKGALTAIGGGKSFEFALDVVAPAKARFARVGVHVAQPGEGSGPYPATFFIESLSHVALASGDELKIGLIPQDGNGDSLCGLVPLAVKASDGLEVPTGLRANRPFVVRLKNNASGPQTLEVSMGDVKTALVIDPK